MLFLLCHLGLFFKRCARQSSPTMLSNLSLCTSSHYSVNIRRWRCGFSRRPPHRLRVQRRHPQKRGRTSCVLRLLNGLAGLKLRCREWCSSSASTIRSYLSFTVTPVASLWARARCLFGVGSESTALYRIDGVAYTLWKHISKTREGGTGLPQIRWLCSCVGGAVRSCFGGMLQTS